MAYSNDVVADGSNDENGNLWTYSCDDEADEAGPERPGWKGPTEASSRATKST